MSAVKDIPIEPKTKAKIEACVKSYCALFPLEYETVVDHIKKKRWLLDDREFGTSIKDSVITRGLFEIPESLDAVIIQYLTPEEMTQFRGLKGAKWFANKFPQFRTPEKI